VDLKTPIALRKDSAAAILITRAVLPWLLDAIKLRRIQLLFTSTSPSPSILPLVSQSMLSSFSIQLTEPNTLDFSTVSQRHLEILRSTLAFSQRFPMDLRFSLFKTMDHLVLGLSTLSLELPRLLFLQTLTALLSRQLIQHIRFFYLSIHLE